MSCAMPVLACSSRKGEHKRRPSVLVPSYLAAFAMHLAVSTGFTPAAWTAPQRDALCLRSGWGRGWIPGGRCRGLDTVDRHRPLAGKRKRLQVMAVADASAGDGGGRGDPRVTGGGEGKANTTDEDDEEHNDFYSVLGLPVAATPEEIKDAYRQTARKVHPDAEGGSASNDRFQMVTAAYEVLSDPGKRSTYDQGLAMKSFVDKVKAGNWGKTLMAVANLGATATSVGVSAGVAAAQPLAKDMARSLGDMAGRGSQQQQSTASEETMDAQLTRGHQAVIKAKADARRKLEVLQRKKVEALAEATKLEGVRETRLKKQAEWNSTLAQNHEEVTGKKQVLQETRERLSKANEEVDRRKEVEQKATETLRQCRVARDTFSQALSSAQRKVSATEAAVAGAEQRLSEALKALDVARQGLESACEQVEGLEKDRNRVAAEHESAGEALEKAKGLTQTSRSALIEFQNSQTAAQMDVRAKTREEAFAAARVKELGDLAEAAGARALKLQTAAEDCEASARMEVQAIEAAAVEEARLNAVAAAAEEEKAQRAREQAARDARAAVEKARAAEGAAEQAAQAAIAAAATARQATADAIALAEGRAVADPADKKPKVSSSSSESESGSGDGQEEAGGLGVRARESIPVVVPATASWRVVEGRRGARAVEGDVVVPPLPSPPPPPTVVSAAVEGAVSDAAGVVAGVAERGGLEEGGVVSMAAAAAATVSGEVRGGDGSGAL